MLHTVLTAMFIFHTPFSPIGNIMYDNFYRSVLVVLRLLACNYLISAVQLAGQIAAQAEIKSLF